MGDRCATLIKKQLIFALANLYSKITQKNETILVCSRAILENCDRSRTRISGELCDRRLQQPRKPRRKLVCPLPILQHGLQFRGMAMGRGPRGFGRIYHSPRLFLHLPRP